MTSDGDSNSIANLLASPAHLPGDPPLSDLAPAPALDADSVRVVQDDNTNKGALLASVDDEEALEVSATAPSSAAPAQAPTPADQPEDDHNAYSARAVPQLE